MQQPALREAVRLRVRGAEEDKGQSEVGEPLDDAKRAGLHAQDVLDEEAAADEAGAREPQHQRDARRRFEQTVNGFHDWNFIISHWPRHSGRPANDVAFTHRVMIHPERAQPIDLRQRILVARCDEASHVTGMPRMSVVATTVRSVARHIASGPIRGDHPSNDVWAIGDRGSRRSNVRPHRSFDRRPEADEAGGPPAEIGRLGRSITR